jgi:ACR3 family arsenite transporter
MVFVWSYLTDGDPVYTLVQVAVNDLIMLVAFAPIVMFLCGVANVVVPSKVLITSVVVFIVIPLAAGWLTRTLLLTSHGKDWFEQRFLPKFHPVAIGALPHNVASPGALIGASNFFELAVAVAITLFGPGSGAALATVVGVLVEVPVMLSVCAACNRTRHWFAGANLQSEVRA